MPTPAELMQAVDTRLAEHSQGVAPLSHEERHELQRLEAIVDRNKAAFLSLCKALHEIYSKRLFREASLSFPAYCKVRFGLERTQIYRHLEAFEVLENTGISISEKVMAAAERAGVNLSVLRALKDVPCDGQVEILRRLFFYRDRDLTKPAPTAREVAQAADEWWDRQPTLSPEDMAAVSAALGNLTPEQRALMEVQETERDLIDAAADRLPGAKSDARVHAECILKSLRLLERAAKMLLRIKAKSQAASVRLLAQKIEAELTAPPALPGPAEG